MADKFGPKVGGLITGMPSTMLFSLFFIAWTQGETTAVEATTIMPIIIGVECIFILVYIFLVQKNFILALLTAYGTWFICAIGVYLLHLKEYSHSVISYIFLTIICAFIAIKFTKFQTSNSKKIIYTPRIILTRGLISGVIVAFIVLLSKLLGPTIGGMFAGFPAMFLSTIIITYKTHGAGFSAQTMKTTIFSVSSLVVYSIVVRYTYVPYGFVLGTLVSVFVTLIYSYLLYKTLIAKLT